MDQSLEWKRHWVTHGACPHKKSTAWGYPTASRQVLRRRVQEHGGARGGHARCASKNASPCTAHSYWQGNKTSTCETDTSPCERWKERPQYKNKTAHHVVGWPVHSPVSKQKRNSLLLSLWQADRRLIWKTADLYLEVTNWRARALCCHESRHGGGRNRSFGLRDQAFQSLMYIWKVISNSKQ